MSGPRPWSEVGGRIRGQGARERLVVLVDVRSPNDGIARNGLHYLEDIGLLGIQLKSQACGGLRLHLGRLCWSSRNLGPDESTKQ